MPKSGKDPKEEEAKGKKEDPIDKLLGSLWGGKKDDDDDPKKK